MVFNTCEECVPTAGTGTVRCRVGIRTVGTVGSAPAAQYLDTGIRNYLLFCMDACIVPYPYPTDLFFLIVFVRSVYRYGFNLIWEQ